MDRDELRKFREARVESLKKNWLLVVGLTWLKSGESTVGSASSAYVVLPESAPEYLAKISLHGGNAVIRFASVAGVKFDGLPVQTGMDYPLVTDRDGRRASVVSVGSVGFHLIERPHGIGVRVKDSESEALKRFQGLEWWEGKDEFRVIGRWRQFDSPRTVIIPDVLGDASAEALEGSVIFTLNGKSCELFPTRDGDRLFFVFKDATTGKSTYGTGRFLNAEVASDGSVVLDFNRAYNPPCAYISHATCPIAPAENKLDVMIEAGEKSPAGHG